MAPDLQAWAAGLRAARLAGGTSDPPPRPLTLAEAYAVQAANAPHLGAPGGWKVGATSPAALAALRIAEPIRAPVAADRLWVEGPVRLAGGAPHEAEPELAIRLKARLRPGGEPAIAELRLAAEIVRPTRPDAIALGGAFLVADQAASWGAWLGPPIAPALLQDPSAILVALSVEGGPRTAGTADAVLGDPRRSLAWLADALGEVPAGQWVLTGAIARSIPVRPGDRLTLEGGRARATVLVV